MDPLADAPANIGTSPYAYVWNNPIGFIDPDGLHGESVNNEYTIVVKNGKVQGTTMTGTKGGNDKDYITVVNMDRAPYADGIKTAVMDVINVPTSGIGNAAPWQQESNPTPGVREIHDKMPLELMLPIPSPGNSLGTTILRSAAKKYTISSVKEALKQVYKHLGIDGPLPKVDKGKWGSPQKSDGTRGYRLDPAHPNRPIGHPERGPHINWWDKSLGTKRGKGLKEDAVPIK